MTRNGPIWRAVDVIMDTVVKFALILAVSISMMAAIAVVAAVPTYFLWNWLMPDLFSIKAITFAQAIGINFMTAVLFKPNVSSSSEKK